MPFYFAYGSNLLRLRLRKRVGSYGAAYKARKPNTTIVFARSYGGHRSGKANIVNRRGHTVYGVLYGLTDQQLDELDRHEGVDEGAYVRRTVFVRLRNGRRKKAIAYVMPKIISLDMPDQKYLGNIIKGLNKWGFSRKIINDVRGSSKVAG